MNPVGVCTIGEHTSLWLRDLISRMASHGAIASTHLLSALPFVDISAVIDE